MFNQSGFKIVIPTRDSERWVGQFLSAYRAIGIEPLYIVDSRSCDHTEAILRAAGADIRLFEPRADFVESGMLEFASQMVSEDWIFRIDDDEFPSLSALQWAHESGCQSNLTAWNLSRRELLRERGQIVYSRLWSHFYIAADPSYLNAQLRFYRHRKVEYTEEIHTAGFIIDESIGFAPQNAYFIHCDKLLRSVDERLEKLRRYERKCPGSSWKFAYNYLPELLAREDHPIAPVDTDEFDSLLSSLPAVLMNREVELTADELDVIHHAIKEFRQELEVWPRRKKMMEDGLTSKPAAWIMCALAAFLKSLEQYSKNGPRVADKLHQFGTDMWYCADLKRRLTS
jgi:glycosyltransferase involved in cell wall biosynthesis